MGGIPEKIETSWVDRHLYSSPQTLLQGKSSNLRAFFLIVVDVVGREQHNRLNGGRGGIRTPDTLSGTPVFKTGAINHSATLPA
jgi:hypothetical protein